MMEPVSFAKLEERFAGVDLVPQAILNIGTDYLGKYRGINFIEGYDDLDKFEGAAFIMEAKTPLEIKHYAGHYANTVTIYLPYDRDISSVTSMIRDVLRNLEISESNIRWERAHSPDL